MDYPIGVIDSGVGGLTVARELMRQLPKENLIYVGDTLRCPYGPRPEEEVVEYTWDMVNFLLEKNIKMLVIACNTATAFTLEELKQKLDIPVVGVIEPGARAAIKTTKTNHIGVLGTEGTIRSNAYRKALKNINSELEIEGLACPTFAPMVEKGVISGQLAHQVVKEALKPLENWKQMDTLILGCTHYPLIKSVIEEVVGDQVDVINSGDETAREISAILGFKRKLYEGTRPVSHQFYATGDTHLFMKIANMWLQRPVTEVGRIKFGQSHSI
ncbi:glutamate racemase [Terribacillus aidingensis]|uniref:Glutamate racemase n=1 Tax=Terribacillus aidingensis TaxID=586416 RepID=A0A285NQ24_9BACI|nr:glutamate racemase [Terribacillus aidingensis]SNZ11549.1 glutamate racemase [Terribacillus aidingensis]